MITKTDIRLKSTLQWLTYWRIVLLILLPIAIAREIFYWKWWTFLATYLINISFVGSEGNTHYFHQLHFNEPFAINRKTQVHIKGYYNEIAYGKNPITTWPTRESNLGPHSQQQALTTTTPTRLSTALY